MTGIDLLVIKFAKFINMMIFLSISIIIYNKCIAIDLCRQRDNSFLCANIASRSELNDIPKILCIG